MNPLAPPSSDIFDIVPPSSGNSFSVAQTALLGLLILSAIAILILWKLKRRPVQESKMDPRVTAVRALDELQAEMESLPPNELMVRTSNVVKNFLLAQYDEPVVFESVEEFLVRQRQRLPSPQRNAVVQFLSSCELIKFGRFPEARASCRPMLSEARTIILKASAESADRVD